VIVTLLEPAQQELEEAVARYESLEQGLGIDLALEFYRSLDRIRDRPQSYQLVSGTARRCILSRFKYQIVYEIMESRIVVLALVHERQAPKTWQDRL